MRFVNLTKHNINVYLPDGTVRTFEPSGTEARVTTYNEQVGMLDGIPVNKSAFGDVENLPSPEEGTIYIVSLLVLQALKGSRQDVVGPDTSPANVIRDGSGAIIGVKGFQIL